MPIQKSAGFSIKKNNHLHLHPLDFTLYKGTTFTFEEAIHEAMSTEEGPGGEGANGENGRDTTDGAPALEDQTRASSSRPSAGEV